MSNPSVSVVAVTDTPTLIFSGCGKVQFQVISSTGTGYALVYGPTNAVSIASAASQIPAAPYEFKAEGEIYAVCPAGSTANVRIVRVF
jgi:hypothetical protein